MKVCDCPAVKVKAPIVIALELTVQEGDEVELQEAPSIVTEVPPGLSTGAIESVIPLTATEIAAGLLIARL